jgi:hypothetical protein
MKALTITYQRVFNLGNYESERVEITLQVEEGERAQDVLDAAKRFVTGQAVKTSPQAPAVVGSAPDLPI